MQKQYSRDQMEEHEEIEEAAVRVEAEADLTARVAAERARIVRAGERCAEAYAGGEEEEPGGGTIRFAEPEAFLSGYNISLPESQSVLRIGPQGPDMEVMRIESPYPYPGPLRRLAYWLVLGWKWERP